MLILSFTIEAISVAKVVASVAEFDWRFTNPNGLDRGIASAAGSIEKKRKI